MMTVKHITLSGEEFLYPTTSVNYTPGRDNLPPASSDPATLWIYDADDRAKPLTGGTCFVMNEHGKTVARYDIGASMVPMGRQFVPASEACQSQGAYDASLS